MEISHYKASQKILVGLDIMVKTLILFPEDQRLLVSKSLTLEAKAYGLLTFWYSHENS